MTSRGVTATFAVALFVRTYGAAAYRGPWPTRDQVVPWALFWTLVREARRLEAREQLRTVHATALAIGLAFDGQDFQVRQALHELEDAADGRDRPASTPRVIRNTGRLAGGADG